MNENLEEGEPCNPGCLSHTSHPCETCGRFGGRKFERGLVACNKCGWVHFSVLRLYAEYEVRRFNEYFDSLTKIKQYDLYNGTKSSIKRYECCFNCNNSYKDFREAKTEDCPMGCTIQSIITKED